MLETKKQDKWCQ